MQRIFGTDGVRGVANKEITAELALNIGRAAAIYFRKKNSHPTFFIGKDTRISGDMLEAALAAGICSAGGSVQLLGVIPTPAIAYLTKQSDASAGIVISASHNPFGDNGIKFFSHEGRKLPDEVEDEIQKIMMNNKFEEVPVDDKIGDIVHSPELARDYVDYIVKTANLKKLNGLKVVVDCANGASYELAPVILKTLGVNTIVIHNTPNGININDKCGSTHLKSLKIAVLENEADLGIAYDGDADRCLLVDEKGNEVNGDQIMLICALELLRDNKLKDNTLVTTVMSNIGLHSAIKKHGGKSVVTAVGDRYVVEEMIKNDYSLGGEQSGHIIFGDVSTTGDGILTSIQVLKALIRNNTVMSDLASVMIRYPQVLENIRVSNKTGWDENENIKRSIEYASNILGEEGRVLVRASGTEPLIRVMLEGDKIELIKELTKYISDVIKKELV